MPKRSKRISNDLAAAHTESFEPYWTAILIIVMGTFTLYGVQAVTIAVQVVGAERVASCFVDSNEPAYHRFMQCTSTKS
jgi:hypothetical protein